MRIALAICSATFALVGCGAVPAAPTFDGERALGLVREQVALGPRYPGSPGQAAVQAWIRDELDREGWVTTSQSFPYRDVTLTNLAARLEGGRGPYILLGAHYDTRRVADRDSLQPQAPVPGADDGASGVAVLLELARLLPQRRSGCDVELVFFDGEDNGSLPGWEWIVGSTHFAERLEREPAAVVIVDMVGDRDLSLPRERTSTKELVDEIWAAAKSVGAEAFVDVGGASILDDHTPFLERGWRAADIIDLQYPYWHTTGDTPDKVSADSLRQVGETLLAWLDETCSP
jgi:glutaminyl-peptide cyclotransferase